MSGTQGSFNALGGLMSMGVPVFLGKAYGTHWWVHGNNGSDNNDGRTKDTPKLTMNAIFTHPEFASGDTIHANGNI